MNSNVISCCFIVVSTFQLIQSSRVTAKKIELVHHPKNAKSFGEGSYVFSTPQPLYEYGQQYEESRGTGYYMKNNDDFPDDFSFDGNLEKYREGIEPSEDEYADGFEYAYDEDEYGEYQQDNISHENSSKNMGGQVYENLAPSRKSIHVSSNHPETPAPNFKLSKSVMDKFYSYLRERFDQPQRRPVREKQNQYDPEFREIPSFSSFGSRSIKQIDHHHHHFDQDHEHLHHHHQQHKHDHDHTENHTYYNNHNHNHKHDHFHEHVEKHEHEQDHKHLHKHTHEHEGHGYKAHKQKIETNSVKTEQKPKDVKPVGYNNNVKAYIDEHKIKTSSALKDFFEDQGDVGAGYLEEVHYIDTE